MINAREAYTLTCEMPDDIIKLILKAIIDREFEVDLGDHVLTHDECKILESFGYRLIVHPVSSDVCCISWEHIFDTI